MKKKATENRKVVSYGLIANGYDELHYEEQFKKFKVVVNGFRSLRRKKFSKVLDVGCGTCLAYDFFKGKICFDFYAGIDKSSEMVKIAKEKLRDVGNCFVCEGKGEKLPFKDSEFDLVLCITAVHNFENPEVAIGELKRVMKEDGISVISVMKIAKSSNEIEGLIKENLKVMKRDEEEKDVIFFCG